MVVDYEFLDDIMEASIDAPFDNMNITLGEETIPVSPIHLDWLASGVVEQPK